MSWTVKESFKTVFVARLVAPQALSRDEGIKLNPSNIKGFANSPTSVVAV